MDEGDDFIQSKKIVVLGATGTIGKMTLDVLKRSEEFEVVGISAHKSAKLLLKEKAEFPGALTALTGDRAEDIDFCGDHAIEALMEKTHPEQVVVGIAGFAGLKHAITAAKYSNRLCLANKESIVAGGDFFLKSVKDSNCEIIPVDSEHNAVFQLIDGEKSPVESIFITASGGAVRDVPVENLKDVTPEMVLKHPIWNMGARITVDSATMFNKGLEIMEAHFLFGFPANKIVAVLHPQGKVHGMIRLNDGTVKMLASRADMRLPIAYACHYPKRTESFEDFSPFGELTFERPDLTRYPALKLAYECLNEGDGARVVYNAADEIAVEAFLKKKIYFTDIYRIVEKVLENNWPKILNDYESIEAVDAKARRLARKMVKRCC